MNDFRIASPDERALSAAEYLLGVLVLAAIVVPIAWAAWRLRAALLPGWSGPPARVAETTLALTTLILLAQLLGTFAAFAPVPMIVLSLLAAAAAELTHRRRATTPFSRATDPTGASGRTGGLREAGSERGRGLREAGLSGRKSQETPSPLAPFSPAQPIGPEQHDPVTPPAPTAGRIALTVAALACAALAAAWAIPTLISIAGGMGRADSLWYHMPLSARFVQTGSLAEIFHFDPIFLAAYYPGSSSILHAVPILAFDRDILSPLLNLGFLALGLLSAWSIGRPYGLPAHALVGGAIALGAQMLVEFQAGQALNDIAGTALILAAVAVLVNASAASSAPASNTWPAATPRAFHAAPASGGGGHSSIATGGLGVAGLAIAGLAVGLAAGMKLSFLAPAGALLLALAAIAGPARRLRTAALFGLPALVAGGYWYARNVVAVGNPIPMVSSIGPIELPGPERTFELRPGLSIAHYWNEPGIWADWFVPGLADSFGAFWPLTLAAIAGAALYALWQRGEPLLRALGAVVLVTSIAYVFTPLTAAGEQGEPISFVWNVRYMAPAAAIGLAILPCLPALRATPWRRASTMLGLAGLLAVTIGSLVQWQQGHLKGASLAAAATLAAFALAAWLRAPGRRPGGTMPRRWGAGLAGAALIAGLAAGWLGQGHYLERRYQNLSPERKLAGAVRLGTDLRDARVAVSGVRGVFNQYPFYGTDLSNRVQWLGWEDGDGGFRRIPTCERWREALAAGDYTHVVTMYDPYNPGALTDTKEGLWTRQDPAARQLLRDGPVSAFELTGELDPAGCDDLPPLSEPELNGDSVNREPLANDPGFSG